MKQSYRYRASNIRVIDGDTIEAVIDLGFYTTQVQHFRLSRINAYELTSKVEQEREFAQKAKSLLGNFLLSPLPVFVESIKTEKYGRWLAEVFVGGDNVNDLLIKSGLVKPYESMAK